MILRTLKASDIFPMVTILNKIGIKDLKTILTPDKIKEMTNLMKENPDGVEENPDGVEENPDVVDVNTILGFNLIFEVVSLILENLPKCEQEIYTFIANVGSVTPKEVENLPMSEFADVLVEIIQKPEFRDFFKAVSKFVK